MSKTGSLAAAPPAPTHAKAATALFPLLARLVRAEDLSEPEAAGLFRALTDFGAPAAQIAGALAALTAKGATDMELAGLVRAQRELTLKIKTRAKIVCEIAGTGGSAAKTFNVSTAAALVAAGAGLVVAKQASRAFMSATGSADVLGALGVRIASEPEVAQTCLSGAGICVMFAPKFHPAERHLADVRRALGLPTALDFLGLLANPAAPARQLLGVADPSRLEELAATVARLGTERTWLVHGADGLDELTIAGETHVREVTKNKVREFRLAPEDFKLPRGATGHLRAASPDASADIIREVLGSRRRDEARALVVINAAAALLVGGLADDPIHAARLAEQSIDSGQAQNRLERLTQTTNRK